MCADRCPSIDFILATTTLIHVHNNAHYPLAARFLIRRDISPVAHSASSKRPNNAGAFTSPPLRIRPEVFSILYFILILSGH